MVLERAVFGVFPVDVDTRKLYGGKFEYGRDDQGNWVYGTSWLPGQGGGLKVSSRSVLNLDPKTFMFILTLVLPKVFLPHSLRLRHRSY